MQIRRLPITHPDALRLIAEVQQEYVARYGTPDEAPIQADVFESRQGAFFVGYLDDEPVAMGGWRRSPVPAFGATITAEVKRMYVAEGARGRGLARQLLARLEQTAAEAGVEAMVLETGTGQPEAIALYESSGYTQVPGFGYYRGSPLSRCFARSLVADGLAEARRVWDAEAAQFDDEPDHGLGSPVTRAAWRDLLLGVLPPAPARVADLGCGTGTLSVLLAEEGYDVTGLDVSSEMIRRATDKARAAGVDVAFEIGDANRPELPLGAFDVVLVRHVLWAMDDPALALRRWVDLLGTGGALVLVEGSWHTGAGLTAAETVTLVSAVGRDAEVRPMPEPVYWGGETGDERYLVVSRAWPQV